jgi:hypothetical protein
MIDAKNKFREGFIITLRPFSFENLNNPIQKFTILWAYSEQPKTVKELTETAKEEVDLILNNTYGPRFFTQKEKEEYIEEQINKVYTNPKNWDEQYKGEIVQTYIDGQLIRLYPSEYNIVSKDKLTEIMSEEGYHAVCAKGLYEIKDFRDKTHYLQSRGIPRHIANKWASMSFKEMVYYKPYYELLTMFCRDYEIYSDSFYEKIEGIKIKDQIPNIVKEITPPPVNFMFS